MKTFIVIVNRGEEIEIEAVSKFAAVQEATERGYAYVAAAMEMDDVSKALTEILDFS